MSFVPETLLRINVVGTSGAGKTTFAKSLATKLGHPVIEMDQLFWLPNWTQLSDELFFKKLSNALEVKNWVLDGNYDRTLPIKWKDVTTVVWIDYSLARTIRQAIMRALTRAVHQKEMWPGTGNRESFRKAFFSRESIIMWTLKTFSRNRQRYEQRLVDPKFSHVNFIRLRNPQEAQRFLNSLKF
jgi:adenylate kinase family enzyme